jgi:hypothetical protein
VRHARIGMPPAAHHPPAMIISVVADPACSAQPLPAAVVIGTTPTHLCPQAPSAHTMLPCILTAPWGEDGAGETESRKRTWKAQQEHQHQRCVPDVARVLSEVCALGMGLVEGVTLPGPTCHRLPFAI